MRVLPGGEEAVGEAGQRLAVARLALRLGAEVFFQQAAEAALAHPLRVLAVAQSDDGAAPRTHHLEWRLCWLFYRAHYPPDTYAPPNDSFNPTARQPPSQDASLR